MKLMILLCLMVGALSACGTIQPAKSSCFVNGRAVCKFTPLPEIWADPSATPSKAVAL